MVNSEVEQTTNGGIHGVGDTRVGGNESLEECVQARIDIIRLKSHDFRATGSEATLAVSKISIQTEGDSKSLTILTYQAP